MTLNDMLALAPKKHYRFIANELIKVAKEFWRSCAIRIPAGTYTSGDIHRYLNKACKNYITLNGIPETVLRRNTSIKVMDVKVINFPLGSFTFPWLHVYYYLSKFERLSGLTGKKAYKFHCLDPRKPSYESTITFEGESQIKKLAKMVRQINIPEKRYCQLSLADGSISGTFFPKVMVNRIPEVQEYASFKLTPQAFKDIPETANLTFRITPEQLKHLYGECKIRIYKDDARQGTINNPYPIRMMIENPDGWIVASCVLENTNTTNIQIKDSQTSETDYHKTESREDNSLNAEHTILNKTRQDELNHASATTDSTPVASSSVETEEPTVPEVEMSPTLIREEDSTDYVKETPLTNRQTKRFYPIPRQLGDILAGDISMPLEKFQLPHTPEVLVREEPITNYHFTPPHRKMLELTTPPKVRYKLVPFKSRLKNSLRL